MRYFIYALLLLSFACNKEEEDKVATPIVPTVPEDTVKKSVYPDTVYFDGLVRNYAGGDCLNGKSWGFDTTYAATVMVEYPDSASIRFNFSFIDYDLDYDDCKSVRYRAERVANFARKIDSIYATGFMPPNGATTYKLRGDSLIITESDKGGKWYLRGTSFSSKRRR